MIHVPFTGGEKESLHASLDRHREAVPWRTEDPELDLRVQSGETTADILAFCARAAADEAINTSELTDTGTAWFGQDVSLRWVPIHMIEETARHAGHDIVRELIDGATGDHRRGGLG